MRHKDFDLAELLDGITRKNVHRETDAGAQADNEVW
jgi:antitoxin component of MazEF toxin-antitoxin module